jgi:hypothetical protein
MKAFFALNTEDISAVEKKQAKEDSGDPIVR